MFVRSLFLAVVKGQSNVNMDEWWSKELFKDAKVAFLTKYAFYEKGISTKICSIKDEQNGTWWIRIGKMFFRKFMTRLSINIQSANSDMVWVYGSLIYSQYQ